MHTASVAIGEDAQGLASRYLLFPGTFSLTDSSLGDTPTTMNPAIKPRALQFCFSELLVEVSTSILHTLAKVTESV